MADVLRAAAVPESDAERIAVLRGLEELKATIAGVQAEVAVAFDGSQRAVQVAQGVPAGQVGRGIAAQVALARRESPHAGGRLLGMARALVREMPCVLAALRSGVLSEYRAMLVVRETACLSVEDRAEVDSRVCGDAVRVAGLGSRRLVCECRQVAYRLDPHSVVRRSAQAVGDRYVSLRPAPDTMTWLTALLPVAQGVAAFAALGVAADSARAAGDGRGRGQLMADRLVERLTGQATAGAVPVGVHLVMSDQTLLAAGDGPAHLAGYGPVPAGVARALVGASQGVAGWVRRLYQRPGTGDLVALESRARCFPKGLAQLIEVRDQTCRTPWCDAPIRHVDHVQPHEAGGATSYANGQGLCEACNHAKQAPGWRASPGPEGAQTVVVETPTGHRYPSWAPQPPGAEPVSAPRTQPEAEAQPEAEPQAQLQPERGRNWPRVDLVFRRLALAA